MPFRRVALADFALGFFVEVTFLLVIPRLIPCSLLKRILRAPIRNDGSLEEAGISTTRHGATIKCASDSLPEA